MSRENTGIKVKSDKKVILFYLTLAFVPFFFRLTELIINALNPDGIVENIIYAIENATNTICLIPASVFTSPIGLILTLLPLLFIKIARVIFIKDKRYSYAAIGAILCYSIFVEEITADIILVLRGYPYISPNALIHIENITNIVTLLFMPVCICFLFWLGQKIVRPDAGKKRVVKLIYLGITIPAVPVIAVLLEYFIAAILSLLRNFVTPNIYYIMLNIGLTFVLPLITLVILFACAVIFRDFRAGLIATACYAIPMAVFASLKSMSYTITYSIVATTEGYYAYRTASNVSTIVSLVGIALSVLIGLIYYLTKILLPYIKMRKKALKNAVPEDVEITKKAKEDYYDYDNGYDNGYNNNYANNYDNSYESYAYQENN